MKIAGILLILLWPMLGACAPAKKVFPPKVMEGVDPDFDFSRWQRMPNEAEVKKVQLGGRIMQSQANDDAVTIIVAQLPVVEHPTYGPKDNGKDNGAFVITYQGRIEESYLQPGNRVMVVGMTQPWKDVTVNDRPRSFPIVAAQCLHLWITQGRDIGDFPYYEAGYIPLIQETVCARTPPP